MQVCQRDTLLSPGFDAVRAREWVAELARQDGVAGARMGLSGSARLRAQGSATWHPALQFALPDPGPGAVSRGRAAHGPVPGGAAMWIERDAAKLLGDARTVALADGTRLAITGSQHDPALAPASTEGVVYAYLPASTLLALPAVTTQSSVLLRFTGVEAERDQARADAAARRAAAWLTGRGVRVQALRVPPLAEHPHQRQADGAVRMLLACALPSAVLCAVTAAALLRGWLDGKRHALGVLKVLGAGRTSLVTSGLIGRPVGRIEEPMSPPTVYRRAPPDEPGTHWRLQLRPGSDPQAVAARLLASAAAMGWPGLRLVTEHDLRRAAAGHLLVQQRALSWVALSTRLGRCGGTGQRPGQRCGRAPARVGGAARAGHAGPACWR